MLDYGQEESGGEENSDFFSSRIRRKEIKEIKKAKAAETLQESRRGIFRDNSDLFTLVTAMININER